MSEKNGFANPPWPSEAETLEAMGPDGVADHISRLTDRAAEIEKQIDTASETLTQEAPTAFELSAEQAEHWERTLENAERGRLVALRVLGRLPVEQEVET